MNLVGRAIWYIESHFSEELTLDQVAAFCAVSRFHLARAFGLATGWPVMRYVRARRLTQAARALANGAPDILSVALDAGYNSHEAFTRAFRDQFGVTPETVRLRGDCDDLKLMEAMKMSDAARIKLDPPRLEHGRALLIAGSRARYSLESVAGIAMQWRNFRPFLTSLPARVGGVAYGVCCEFDESGHYDYVCGVEVSRTADLPRDFCVIRIPARDYHVFRHTGHIAAIGATWQSIMNDYPPPPGMPIPDAPCFERYAEDFDGLTGMGGVEIWIPAAA